MSWLNRIAEAPEGRLPTSVRTVLIVIAIEWIAADLVVILQRTSQL